MASKERLDERVAALERGIRLIHDMTKIERVAYLATNIILVGVLLAIIVYAFFVQNQPATDLKIVSVLVGGGGGSVVAVLTWRILGVWERYFRALERVLEAAPRTTLSDSREKGGENGRTAPKPA